MPQRYDLKGYVRYNGSQSLTADEQKQVRDNITSQAKTDSTVGIKGSGADFIYQSNGNPIHYAEAVKSALAVSNTRLTAETVNFITKSGNAGLIIPRPNRTITGAGVDQTVINSSRPDYVIRYRSEYGQLSNNEYSKFTIDCQNIANTSGIEIRDFSNLYIHDLILKRSVQWLMKLTNEPAQTVSTINEKALIENVVFDTQHGIYEMFLIFNTNNIVLRRVTFKNKTGSPGFSPTLGFWQKVNGAVLEDCVWENLVSDAIYYSFTTNDIKLVRPRFLNTGRAINGANVSDYGKFGAKSVNRLSVDQAYFEGGTNSLNATAIKIGAIQDYSITNTYITKYKRGVLIGYGNEIPTAVDGTVNLTIVNGVITAATLSGQQATYNPNLTYHVDVFLNGVEVTDVNLQLVINSDGTAQSTINVVNGTSASNLTGATARNRNGGDARYPSSNGKIEGLSFYDINPDSVDTNTFSCIDFGNGGNYNTQINFSVDNSTGSLAHAVTFNGKTLATLTLSGGVITSGAITETEAWYDKTINYDQSTGVITRSGTGLYTCQVTDATGTGAVVRLAIDADGRAYGLDILSGGSGYTAPTITCPGGYHGQLQFNNCDFDGLGIRRNDNCVVDWETIQFNNCINLDSTSFPTDFARNASIKSTRTIALRPGLLSIGKVFANIVNDAIFQIGEAGAPFLMRFGSFRQRHANSSMQWIFANFPNLFWRVYKDQILPGNLKLEFDVDSGSLRLSGGLRTVVPTYADNASAISGGLVAGDVYKTPTGELRIVV